MVAGRAATERVAARDRDKAAAAMGVAMAKVAVKAGPAAVVAVSRAGIFSPEVASVAAVAVVAAAEVDVEAIIMMYSTLLDTVELAVV